MLRSYKEHISNFFLERHVASEPQSFQVYYLNAFLRSYAFTIQTKFDKAEDLRREINLFRSIELFRCYHVSKLLLRKEKQHGKKQKKMDSGRGTEI